MPKEIKAIIDRIEEDFLVLEIEGGQELFWPKKDLYDFKEGDELIISLNKGNSNRENTIKDLLREIFKRNV